jgi:hypothetical protein
MPFMRNILIFFILILLCLVPGCTQIQVSTTEEENNNIEARQIGKAITIVSESGSFCTLELGMTLDEATQLLGDANIELHGSLDDYLYSDNYDYSLFFNQNNNLWILNQIAIKCELVETEKGLKVGDINSKIIELYGEYDKLTINEETGSKYYNYNLDGYRLIICAGYEDGGWGYSFEDDSIPQYVEYWHIVLDK